MGSNHATGHAAETRAAAYLTSQGFRVEQLNWKTRYCEIDIVAEKSGVMYFVEVKYRRNDRYGNGLEYVTAKKLQRMSFAAEVWVQQHQWRGSYQLAALGVDGEQMRLVEDIYV